MKKKYSKPRLIGVIPMIEIEGEVWGFEVSELSEEEKADLKAEHDKNTLSS